MAKIIAFDYGLRRTGIAETDELQIIASGLTTVETPELFAFIKTYLKNNRVEGIVVGDPGEGTHNTEPANEFTKKLSKLYPSIPITRIDERYTSVMAKQAMIIGGMKKKKRREKGMVDKISATLILQAYLEEKSRL